MNWEVFVDRGGRNVGPTVTVHKRGTLGLSHAAFVLLGEPSHVMLLHDPDGDHFGLRATDSDDRNAYPVQQQRNVRSYIITASAFVAMLGTIGLPSRRFDAELQGDVLVVDRGQHALDTTTGDPGAAGEEG